MLAEGFLRVLRYREERKFATASKIKRSQTHTPGTDQFSSILSESISTDLQTDSAEEGKQPYYHTNHILYAIILTMCTGFV